MTTMHTSVWKYLRICGGQSTIASMDFYFHRSAVCCSGISIAEFFFLLLFSVSMQLFYSSFILGTLFSTSAWHACHWPATAKAAAPAAAASTISCSHFSGFHFNFWLFCAFCIRLRAIVGTGYSLWIEFSTRLLFCQLGCVCLSNGYDKITTMSILRVHSPFVL